MENIIHVTCGFDESVNTGPREFKWNGKDAYPLIRKAITERPETREDRRGASATAIAEHVAVLLDRPAIRYQGRRSSVDRQTGAVTVTITFNTDLALRAEADTDNNNENEG